MLCIMRLLWLPMLINCGEVPAFTPRPHHRPIHHFAHHVASPLGCPQLGGGGNSPAIDTGGLQWAIGGAEPSYSSVWASPVPEPATWLLLAIGFAAGAVVTGWRRAHAAS